nr:biotin--[acetyl-CoA-carboxylase] ligase [Alkalibaculum sporogenes]
MISLPDTLHPYEIKSSLDTKRIGKTIHYFEEISSTNDYAKKLAQNAFEDGEVIIAGTQKSGRGRFSREWISPPNKGIYISLLLKPQISFENITQLTLFTALAICNALEEYVGINLEIKWPNDILLNSKKICGILTEISGEVDKINHVIIGFGINVNFDKVDFDDTLKNKATSLKIETSKTQDRKKIIQHILTVFDKYYEDYLNGENFENILKQYKSKMTIIEKNIVISIHNNTPASGTVIDITNSGALKIKMSDGSVKEFLSGEISLNPILD